MMDDIAPQGAAGAEAPKRAIGAEIRSKLNHPVIDGDGHAVELSAALPDYLSQIVGPDQTREWTEKVGAPTVLQVPPGGWWLSPSGPITIDRAMAMLPAMRKERNQAVGIDFSVVYTTLGLQMLNIKEDERRRAFSRALNMMNADVYGGFSDCMTVSAIVPVESPAEAIDELEFVTSELDMKTITINGYVAHQPTDDEPRRVIPLALDSLEDYDPFWQRCLDLGVSVACHGGSSGTDRHASRVNYTFNHISTFADHNEFFCRSLFFGGVPKRFPELNFAFLEGGVGWACNLYHNIYEHWERRNAGAMGEFLDPRTLDVELLAEMAEAYATPGVTPERVRTEGEGIKSRLAADADVPDDFALCAISCGEDIRDQFTHSFYFGCEADDRMAAVAFDEKLLRKGARIKAVFGSDIGHWDVQDALGVLGEAHELVDDDLISDEDFGDFTFANSVRLHGRMNPDFFKGTVIEAEAAAVLKGD
ncbi:MAG: amidohydrolase family protein [Rhodospirillaceae bacterium]|nr:amidohydrolase family protein [Rhodospirillaceae bacterium]MBT7572176.1 amidohydrolase family protein [Rhodospirillaceae bacterium]